MTRRLPYGVRDIKLRSISSSDVVGASVDLPVGRTLSFHETEDSTELRGDDTAIASHGAGARVTWTLEAGGIDISALVLMTGGTYAAGPPESLLKKDVDARPYFQIEGQVISDSGGDIHCIIYKAKATGDIGGDFSEGAFFLTGATGLGYPDPTGQVYKLIYNVATTAITAGPPTAGSMEEAFQGMSKAQLSEAMGLRGIDLPGNPTKGEMIDALLDVESA